MTDGKMTYKPTKLGHTDLVFGLRPEVINSSVHEALLQVSIRVSVIAIQCCQHCRSLQLNLFSVCRMLLHG